MVHLSVRSRYRLLFICSAILLFRFFLPYGRNTNNSIEHDITDSINSILRLSARICKTGGNEGQKLTSFFRDGSRSSLGLGYKGPPGPLSQVDRSNKKNENKNKNSKPATRKLPSSSDQQQQHQLAEPRITIHKTEVNWGGHDGPDPPKPPSKPPRTTRPPINDPFPLLSKNLTPFYAKLLKERTAEPYPHPPEETPLFIGFTRNWPQLIQCVVSYIAAGWPASDIYVVENTGVMNSNRNNLLTLQNPFYLNHTQLDMLGVNVLITPTLLSFSQLQNFYAWTAGEKGWDEYFWSHQDVVVFSDENFGKTEDDKEEEDKKAGGANNIYDRNSPNSLYHRAVSVLQNLRGNKDKKLDANWANVFFAYDQLTLVNVKSIVGVGGWDTHIPFYTSDCDMYMRQTWGGWTHYSAPEVGIILDVASVLDDVGALLRLPGIHASFKGDPGVPLEEQAWWRAVNSLDDSKSLPPSPFMEEEVSSSSDDDSDDDDQPTRKGQDRKEKENPDPYERSKSTSAQETFLHEMNILTRRTKQVDRHGETFSNLLATVQRMSALKYAGNTNGHRNTWQSTQSGGEGEPFHRDPDGFEQGVLMAIDLGRAVFAEKWGHRGCDVSRMKGMGNDDAWRLERDWDLEGEGWGYEGDGW